MLAAVANIDPNYKPSVLSRRGAKALGASEKLQHESNVQRARHGGRKGGNDPARTAISNSSERAA